MQCSFNIRQGLRRHRLEIFRVNFSQADELYISSTALLFSVLTSSGPGTVGAGTVGAGVVGAGVLGVSSKDIKVSDEHSSKPFRMVNAPSSVSNARTSSVPCTISSGEQQ